MVPAALALDLIVGDPMPHPTVAIGALIKRLEGMLYKPGRSSVIDKSLGALAVAIAVFASYAAAWLIIHIAAIAWKPLGWIVEVYLIASAVAAKSMRRYALRIADAISLGNLGEARKRAAEIVGRDTRELEPRDLARAAVESVAENSVDAVIAPLFYAFIGGGALALAYRAVNTLDSMLGYRNERYANFGWAAAKLDDLANYLPARLALASIALASPFLGMDGARAWRTARRDAANHPSPNGGVVEAAFAGALGVRLGGVNRYGSELRLVGYFGDEGRPLDREAIERANSLFLGTAISFAAGGLLLTGAAKLFLK